ncbi:hypothetical protein [Desulfospira joergensenii]|uniref:hypothetical protein n=1 Tax=Desulfospira joergensenii TaxID=53329 RepID=UPI0003B4F157|nr:hypothetical protein [Desulfospira joergensenii]
MITIHFAVGHENQVSIITSSDRTPENGKDIDALYKEIEAGCPTIRNYRFVEGLFKASYSAGSDKLHAISRYTYGMRNVA